MPFQVLIVCAGNICRSPMAEALLRRALEGQRADARLAVGSAGTIAAEGTRASSDAVAVMRDRYGLDLSDHRARRLTRRTRADLLLVVDEQVAWEAEELGLTGRVELLGDYAGFPGECVEDPYLEPREAFETCARQLERLATAAARRLVAEANGAEAPDRSAPER